MRQAVDAFAVDLLTQLVLAQFKQRSRIVVDKLRVPLEAQHLITNVVSGVRTEIA
ncbi:hypothetical protein D3C78_1161740 [compost metagenome]